MAEILVFHHAQGLTAGVLGFADELRAAGHAVHTPDLFDGRTFDTIEEGVGYAQRVGFGEIIERGVRAAENLPRGIVYGGFSLGVLPTQKLAQTRPGARGALLFSGCVPVSEFGTAWPSGVPVQVHAKEADPFFAEDLEAAQALVSGSADAQMFLYPGEQHLFADGSLASHDPEASALLTRRVIEFLDAR
ncbi:dienelactone hydrolase family protein [Streptomyces sp. FH025]|uniref:dienelactone hydrolase family protein n=1 Tax=Streptomyces sp. FH025 TaxID=2815937 RepID=UPI001A9E586F|nr:dienelactone hydrolase family protein [Streptomyces sp. FH025]MBO1414183.1 dienelactone hydrolase family protein [Streptomyces sp. FH025]